MAKNTDLTAPAAELLQSQKSAIRQYKQVESEKAGYDIGWERASQEWFDKHFTNWVTAERLAIDQLLAKTGAPAGRGPT